MRSKDRNLPFLLRWLFLGSREAFRLRRVRVKRLSSDIIFEVQNSILTDSERKFQSAMNASGQLSFFTFHGSSNENWLSILLNGFNISRRLHGRAYGNGVYGSNRHRIALKYARSGYSWNNSFLRLRTVSSILEVAYVPSKIVDTQPFTVVDPDIVHLKYLIVGTWRSHRRGPLPPLVDLSHTGLIGVQKPLAEPYRTRNNMRELIKSSRWMNQHRNEGLKQLKAQRRKDRSRKDIFTRWERIDNV